VSELEVMGFASAADWTTWLEREHERSPGLWLKIVKKDADAPGVTHAEALEAALCFGWIDSQARGLDDTHWLQRFTPRRARGRWSKINREAAQALIDRGAMRPAGLRQVEAAQADGRWAAAYAGARTAIVPDDLQAALDADPEAAAFFATLSGANRYAILYRLQDAKRPETRARRLATYVAMLRARETLH
jgi:uncharacterized protein YdeI (YjbR/CyaY-like superfamily)